MFQFVKEYKKRQRRKFFLVSLFSLAFGGILALFLSPKSGEENRRMVVDKSKEAVQRVREESAKAPEYLKQTGEKVEKNIKSAVRNLREQVEQLESRLVESAPRLTHGTKTTEEEDELVPVIDVSEEKAKAKK